MEYNNMDTVKYTLYNKDKQEYWCETCDREFPTLHLVEHHKKQHQKCNIDGCQFVAHPKVVTKHIQMQHSTGLYKRIAKLNDPKEIQKWIEERKKKYPTKKNITEKAEAVKEKLDRGEKIGLQNKQKFAGRTNNVNGFGNYRQRNNKNLDLHHRSKSRFVSGSQGKKNRVPFDNNHKQFNKKQHKVEPAADDNKKLNAFTGIGFMNMDTNVEDQIDNCNFNIFDVDDDYPLEVNSGYNGSAVEPTVCSAISTLISNYASSEDEVDLNLNISQSKQADTSRSNQEHIFNNISPQNIHQNNPMVVDKSDNDSGPEEINIIKKNDSEIVNEPVGKKTNTVLTSKYENKHRMNIPMKHAPNARKLPSTLLVKLLEKEIRQERNVILQCIRYVVKNKYFDQTPA